MLTMGALCDESNVQLKKIHQELPTMLTKMCTAISWKECKQTYAA